MSKSLEQLNIKLFADGAELDVMHKMAKNPLIKGFTTNPTLMKKAGIKDYEEFSRQVVKDFPSYPISLEVFADDLPSMELQAKKLATFGNNVFVKIPITNSKGISTAPIIKNLSEEGIKLNITAIMLLDQIKEMVAVLKEGVPTYLSVFAGRIADTGQDPIPLMKKCLEEMRKNPSLELLWASPRELLNIFQADDIGCHIITATKDILSKLDLHNKDLKDYSLETVKMFYEDAHAAAYTIAV